MSYAIVRDNFVDNEIAFALDLVEKMKSIASSL